jgi:hypothetical protein
MPTMNAGTQRLCAWSGIAFVTLFFIGFGGLAGFVPPPSPNENAAQIAQLFTDHTFRIRAGLVLTSLCSALLLPFFAVISVQLKRIEGAASPLAYLQMTAGALACLEFIFPVMIWQAAAFRPGRSPDAIQLLNDLGWLPFLGIVSTAIVQGVAIGIAILRDTRATPIFPRWSGYFNIWAISLLAPGGFIVLFKTGPLAWNGVLAWWLVLAAYFSWIVVNTILLLRAINQQSQDDTNPVRAGHPQQQSDLAAEIAVLREQLERLVTLVRPDDECLSSMLKTSPVPQRQESREAGS